MKKTRVYVNGKRFNDIYVGKTNWQVFRYRVGRFFRRLLVLSTFAAIIFFSLQIGRHSYPVTKFVQAEDTMAAKVETMKWELVHNIQTHEAAGHTEDDGIIIFDTNKEMSIGTYQYQKKTVIYYYKSLYGKDITPKEAVLIALDDEKAEQLTYDVLFKTEKGWSNWFNASKKYDIPAKIAVIKELEK